jgi:hypothetical protein
MDKSSIKGPCKDGFDRRKHNTNEFCVLANQVFRQGDLAT